MKDRKSRVEIQTSIVPPIEGANDLMAELQKDSIKLDDDSERKVVKMLLKLLEDKNGEVRTYVDWSLT